MSGSLSDVLGFTGSEKALASNRVQGRDDVKSGSSSPCRGAPSRSDGLARGLSGWPKLTPAGTRRPVDYSGEAPRVAVRIQEMYSTTVHPVLGARHQPILFDLLDATAKVGITLTESQAMLPTSAVSGFYFGHPDSAYFGVARIGEDQLEDYAARRGMELSTAERWLRPNLH